MKKNSAIKSFQILLIIIQIFGLIGCTYNLIIFSEIYFNINEFTYYSETDVILLIVTLFVSICNHIIGILGTIKKNVILITVFIAIIFVGLIIFFDETQPVIGIWFVISAAIAITLVAMLHQNYLKDSDNNNNNNNNSHSHPDNPPDYYSVVPQPNQQITSQFQSVDLIAVPNYDYRKQLQRY